MDRRRFLYVAGMVGAVAGCAETENGEENSSPSDNSNSTETEPDTESESEPDSEPWEESEEESDPVAEFREENLSVDSTRVFTDESVNVAVDITNIGGQSGAHRVDLIVDDERQESKQVEIEQDDTVTVEFSVNLNKSGMYEVRVGESTEMVQVDSAPDFRISTVQELQEMENYLNVDYALVDDIDASETTEWNDGKGFSPIGSDSNPFTGTFNGRGYEIRGLYIDRREILGTDTNDGDMVGLFKQIGSDGVVKDVGVTDVDITGANSVGAISGSGGTIKNSYSSGNVSVIPTNEYDYNWQGGAGGLVGGGGDIENSHSTATVNGGSEVGGLVGRGGSVTDSYASGRVSGESSVGGLIGRGGNAERTYSSGHVTGEDRVGGLVGYSRGEITDSYSTGDVEGDALVGGLVGRARELRSPSSCYSVGSVSGNEKVGGLVGSDGTARFVGQHSFWDVDTSGQSGSAGEAEGKPTFLMQTIETYPKDYWNIAIKEEYTGETWYIDERDNYPMLGWQYNSE